MLTTAFVMLVLNAGIATVKIIISKEMTDRVAFALGAIPSTVGAYGVWLAL